MALYYVRHDSMTQATTTFAAVETGSDGSTAGPVAIPPGTKRIKAITASFTVDGAAVTNSSIMPVLRLSGTGALPDGAQDLILGAYALTDGGGTLTYTDGNLGGTVTIPCDIAVNGGADLSLSAAYYGTDAGSPGLSVELEFE